MICTCWQGSSRNVVIVTEVYYWSLEAQPRWPFVYVCLAAVCKVTW